MVRHSHQDAVTESEFDQLVKATDELEKPYDAESLFILVTAGRLGLRAGEIAHLREGWIDWNTKQIHIPRFDACDHGDNGSICGYCKSQAQLAVENGTYETLDEALENRWEPKCENSARTVPFDFDPFIETVVREFFVGRDRYPHSRVSVNRRVDRVLEAAGFPSEYCYPHSLRATAASWHAYRGLPAPALQSLFGWSNIQSAQKYIRLSGSPTAKALKETHSE